MTNYGNARNQYLESEILSAGPVRRVQLMYEGAIEAIGAARAALEQRDIPTRAAKVNKALDILTELSMSLDHGQGAPVTRELVELYDYSQRCLIEGSSKQEDRPFADAERVLRTLLEAWKSVPEVEGSVASLGSYVPVDYSAGDGFGVGRVGSGLDQVG